MGKDKKQALSLFFYRAMTKKNNEIAVENFILHHHVERPIDWSRRFDTVRPLDVEIGFGLGDFLVRTAQQYSERNFVGIEMDWQRVKKTLRKIHLANKIGGSCSSQTRHPEEHSDEGSHQNAIQNVRVLQVDANVAFSRLFAPLTIHNLYCLFPCPWPKKNHVKHRLFSHSFLRLSNSRLVSGGRMKIVTDHFSYFEWILAQAKQTGFQIETRTIEPQFDTKYERKWREGGQTEFFELNFVKQEHFDIPVQEDAELQAYFVDDFKPDRFRFPDVTGEESVIWKDFLFDARKEKGMVHLVVAEKNMAQHLWVMISHGPRGWCISKAEGHNVIPTRGVAQAIRLVYQQVKQTKLDIAG